MHKNTYTYISHIHKKYMMDITHISHGFVLRYPKLRKHEMFQPTFLNMWKREGCGGESGKSEGGM